MYFTVKTKFIFAVSISLIWLIFSAWLSIPWIKDLSRFITIIPALIIITSIALIPGFMYMFLTISYLVDNRKKRPFNGTYPGVSILIAAFMGYYFIAGPMTLAVLPLGLLNNVLFLKGSVVYLKN